MAQVAAAASAGVLDLDRVLQVTAAALAGASATLAVARSLGISWSATEEGAAAAAVIALTLAARDLTLTLEERSLALTLVSRSLVLTLQERE